MHWGIAGTGKMAELFARDFVHVPGAHMAAVGSRRPESASAFAARHGIARAHGSYGALIEDPDIDIIHVATPHPQHHVIARAAIDAGKSVLVEKAFTATLAGGPRRARACAWGLLHGGDVDPLPADRLARPCARGRGRDLRGPHGPGRPGAFREYDADDRLFSPRLGGGSTLDLGVYAISIAEFFLGRPDRVHASGTQFPNGADASLGILMGTTTAAPPRSWPAWRPRPRAAR